MESKEKKIRCFIAVPVAVTLQLNELLIEVQQKLKAERIRWIDPMQMHLTLKFIGDIPESEWPIIADELKSALEGEKSFRVELIALGAFGKKENPNVLWCGFAESDGILGLRRRVMQMPSFSGLRHQDYKAHLTLGRMKHVRDNAAFHKMLADSQSMEFGSVTVSSVVLYQSILDSTGAKYKMLEELKLC